MSGWLPLGSPYSDVRCDLVEHWEEKLEKTSIRYRRSLQRGNKGVHWRGVRSSHLEEKQTSTNDRRLNVRLEGTTLDHTSQDERRARRQMLKAQRVRDTVEDVLQSQQLRKEERIQQHVATFGGKPGSGGHHIGSYRARGGRALKRRSNNAHEPQLDESRELITSSYWFSPPPTRDECMRRALRTLVQVTMKQGAGSNGTEEGAVCVVCACELFDEEQQEHQDAAHICVHKCNEDAHSDSGWGSDSDSEAGGTLHSHQSGRLSLCSNALRPTTASTTNTTNTSRSGKSHGVSNENVVSIQSCGHRFHRECISRAFEYNTRCPVCLTPLAPLQGPQPEGSMRVSVSPQMKCAGHASSCGTIIINYNFPRGRQDERHENPGCMYSGTVRTAFLPNDNEGRKVLRLLQIGFDRRVLFRVGTSITTGISNTVVWNGIHHKTYTGPGSFGYPDPTYLSRVTEELRAWGIE